MGKEYEQEQIKQVLANDKNFRIKIKSSYGETKWLTVGREQIIALHNSLD